MATQNAIGRLDKTQNIAYTGTPATSAAIGPQTSKIRLQSTTACAISIGAAVGVSLPADLPEYFIVTPGEVVSVVQISAAGTLNLVEIA